jgi:ketosteroid isomerase-like protein
VRRIVELTMDAFNRRDLSAVLAGTHPGFEYCPERSWVEAGLVEHRYVGLAGYRDYIATVDEVWGGQNYLTPVEVIDLGDRFAMFADAEMRAQASGVPLSQEYAAILTVKDGAVVRLQEYFDHGRALEALGLGEPS